MRCLLLLLSWFLFPVPFADASAPCRLVRFADVGWTDSTVTTAVVSTYLRALGYQTTVTQASVPVTFRALKSQDLDVFLGNWMPSMAADIKPYTDDGSVDTLPHPLLSGAKYTLAVPDYVAASGVRSFSDLARFRDRFQGKIYGIEPGNDGNRLLLKMIESHDFGLSDWKLLESSEQAMLAQVLQAYRQQEWVVFLGWAPHPMNTKMSLTYLKGGDAYFGSDSGSAQVFMNTRRGLSEECPELGRFLSQLTFSMESVNELMAMVLDQKLSPEAAAVRWLNAHPNPWNSSLQTPDRRLHTFHDKESPLKQQRFGLWVQDLVETFVHHFDSRTHALSQAVSQHLQAGINTLVKAPAELIGGGLCLLLALVRRRLLPIFYAAVALFLVHALGYWRETLETLSLILLASTWALSFGIPLGVLSAKFRIFHRVLQPMLDIMQTLPTFVYLIPALMLFGLGLTPGLIATFIFVLPIPIRLTYLGLSAMPKALHELGLAFGANAWQRLWNIELPYAWPTIRTAISQSLMLSLSMVVIAALVGADGLGKPVVQALNTIDIAKGFEAGLAIVILALALDRSVHSASHERSF